MRHLVTVFGPNGLPAESVVLENGESRPITVTAAWATFPGQKIDLGIAAYDPDDVTPSKLEDACAVTMADQESPEGVITEPLVWVKPTWDLSYIPSVRTLADILTDVVDHTAKEPTHGAMCACMDQFSREIRQHVRKAMPPDTRIGEWPHQEDQGVVRARVMADHRIHHVLGMVLRNL